MDTTSMNLVERFRIFQAGCERAAPDRADRRRQEVKEALSLRAEETPLGTAYLREQTYEASHRHGPVSLGRFLELPPEGLGLLAIPPSPLAPASWLFLDTETTGLAGGPGTIVFQCGLAFFEQGTLVIRQYVAPDPAAEPALIWSVLREVSRFPGLVSFNGKTFDWPLLRDRLVLTRQVSGHPLSIPEPIHADLLFPARWLFRHRLSSCRLTCLENEILACARETDIPSELIPAIYLDFLRGGSPASLEAVLLHNRLDLLTLVALACRLLEPWLEGTGDTFAPEELYGLARMLAARGLCQQALPLWEKALPVLPRPVAGVAAVELGRLYRRLGFPDQAARVWQSVADPHFLASPVPLIELAKYFEHQRRDFQTAREMVLRAIRLVQTTASWYGGEASLPRLRHRLARLEHKLRQVTKTTGRTATDSPSP